MTRDNYIVSSSLWNIGTHIMVDFSENLKKMISFIGFCNIQIFICNSPIIEGDLDPKSPNYTESSVVTSAIAEHVAVSWFVPSRYAWKNIFQKIKETSGKYRSRSTNFCLEVGYWLKNCSNHYL